MVVNWSWGKKENIENFTPSTDTIFIDWINPEHLEITETNGDTIFTVLSNGGRSITLEGVTLAELSSNNFNIQKHTTADKVLDLLNESAAYGDDTLRGGDGDDVLEGGAGMDTLEGGSGSDVYIFSGKLSANNVDIVLDYKMDQGDILDISDLVDGDIDGDEIGDYARLFNDANGDTFLQVDTNGSMEGQNYITVVSLSGVSLADQILVKLDENNDAHILG